MTDTVEMQLRLMVESACARAFPQLVDGPLADCPVTLILADYSDYGYVAWNSTLAKPERIALLREVVDCWDGVCERPEPTTGRMFENDELVAIAQSLSLPGSIGMALFIGAAGERISYISNIDRDDALALYRGLPTTWETGSDVVP